MKNGKGSVSLSIAHKAELLQKLDICVSVHRLTDYGVGTTTIYDLKKQKHKLLKFYSDSDDQKLMKNRKTLHSTKKKILTACYWSGFNNKELNVCH